MPEEAKKPLIPHRVMLVGEEQIPQQVVEELGDRHMQIFMREPDPREWPEQMQHLVGYLPVEEQVGFLVSAALASHDDLLRDMVDKWAAMVWKDIGDAVDITSYNRELVIGEMMRHAGEVVSAWARSLEEPDA